MSHSKFLQKLIAASVSMVTVIFLLMVTLLVLREGMELSALWGQSDAVR